MNFVVMVHDGLRADRLSCYGYEKRVSPTMDSLAERGILFRNFFTPVTPTQPAITTLLTGQFPATHRILAQSGRNSLDRKAPWLPAILRKHGFATAAVDGLATEKRWFSRGFDTVLDPRKQFGERAGNSHVNSLAIPWLQNRRRNPFFLFVHYYDAHAPYIPSMQHLDSFYHGDPTSSNSGSLDAFYRQPLKPDLITSWLMPFARDWPGAAGDQIEDLEFVRALYDAAIRTADDGVAQILEVLQRLHLLDDTVVLVIADHGQELGEHGIYFEQHGLYESTIHIPFIVCGPGISQGVEIDSIQQLPDVAPTILDLAKIVIPKAMQGRSLAPVCRGQGTSEGYDAVLAAECTWMAKWAYRTHRHKLIVAREPDFYAKPMVELYDLLHDPGEQVNIAGEEVSLCRSLQSEMESSITSSLPDGSSGKDPITQHGVVRGLHSYHINKTLREFKRPLLSGVLHEVRRKVRSLSQLRSVRDSAQGVREWRYPEFKTCLDDLAPLIGAHDWRLALLRRQARITGVFPTALYGILRRFSRRNPPRPYFVGITSDEVLFLGDFRDPFSVASAVVPFFNHTVTEFLRTSARANPAGFLDIGANLGIVAASVARDLRGLAEVYAIEASAETARRAAATFALNKLTNVRLYPCAAGMADGIVDLYHVPGRSAIASVRLTDLLKEHSRVMTTRVDQRSIDSMCREFRWNEIGLMKIDVEGNEMEVLEGSRGLIDSFKPSILYENNPRTTSDPGAGCPDPRAPLGGYVFKGLRKDGTLSEFHEAREDEYPDVWCVPENRFAS